MRQEQVEEAARLLAGARGGPPLDGLPAECRPQSVEDAYQIQDAVAHRLGEAVGGWKVGVATAAAPGFCAPIFARLIRSSPAAYTGAEMRLIGIEAEIAFRLGRDLPARAAPYGRDEVASGATMHPVIEVVDSRYVDFRSLDRLQMLADNFSNGGLVYAAAVPGWELLDLSRPAVVVTRDGAPFAESNPEIARDPLGAAVEFVNIMNMRGGVKAATFVTTGTLTRLVFAERGARIVADFGALGRIEVEFPG
jgi:2-keto-4-pentenoate hydratase